MGWSVSSNSLEGEVRSLEELRRVLPEGGAEFPEGERWEELGTGWASRRCSDKGLPRQSILISHEHSSEGLTLKRKCQSFGHLMQRTDSLEKTLMLGKIEGRRRRG